MLKQDLIYSLQDWIDDLSTDMGYVELHPSDAEELKELLKEAIDALN